jgi:hypothetical protein
VIMPRFRRRSLGRRDYRDGDEVSTWSIGLPMEVVP